MFKERVVITGVGVVAPNGVGKEAFWQALMQGLSGVRPIRRFDTSSCGSRIGGELADFDPLQYFEAHELKKLDRSSIYAIAAGTMALKDSGLELKGEDLERIGSSIGNAVGGIDYVNKEIDVLDTKGPRWTSPYLAIAFFPCATNGLLSIRLGVKGVVLTLCNGNTSGSDAIGMAYRTIQSGRADVMFAGGTEAPLVPMFLASLNKDEYLSKRNESPSEAVRPFDTQADGMVLAEGAGILVMESLKHAQARGARIYAELGAYASGTSAFDALRSEANGWGLVHTMRRALAEANVAPEEAKIIHGQGLSLPDCDAMEANAIAETFASDPHLPSLTAVSSWTGNSLGALGGVQSVASALMISERAVPAVANFHTGCSSLPVLEKPTLKLEAQVVVQNSYCFMGKSSTLVLRRFVR